MTEIKNNLSVFTNGDPSNKPIIFIHGFPFDHHMWNKQTEELSSLYFCVSYDVRGLGKSPAEDGQFTMEMFADDVIVLIDELKLVKPVLCGLSMGGYIALRTIEKKPDLFKALILCDTKSAADNDDAKIKRAAGIKKINEEGVKSFVEEFIPNCFAEESIIKLDKDYKELVNRSSNFSAEGVKGCLLAMAVRTDTTEFLKKLKVPALLICGEKDKLTPPSVMKEISDSIPDSEFHIIPKAGHVTPLENPEEVNKILKNFLTKIL